MKYTVIKIAVGVLFVAGYVALFCTPLGQPLGAVRPSVLALCRDCVHCERRRIASLEPACRSARRAQPFPFI